MNAGLSESLHSQQHDLQAGRLRGVRSPYIAAAVSVADGDNVFCPIICQGFDGPDFDAAFFTGPFRGLGDPVFLAEDIVCEFIKPISMGRDIFLIISVVCQPLVGDRQLQSRIRIRQDRDPFVGVDGGAVVEVRADVNALDPQFRKPVAKKGRHLHAESQRGDLRVAAPKEQAVTVLRHIRDQVALGVLFAYRFAAPDMLGTPVPAFPGIHVAHLLGIAAGERKHPVGTAVGRGNIFSFPVHIGFAQNGFRRIGLIDPFDLIRAQFRCFFPGNALVAADPAGFRMPVAVRIPVDPLHGI